MKITTIKLQDETKNRLDKLKESRAESYDDIIRKILYILNTTRDDPLKAKRILEKISEIRERWIESETKEKEEKTKDKQSKTKIPFRLKQRIQ